MFADKKEKLGEPEKNKKAKKKLEESTNFGHFVEQMVILSLVLKIESIVKSVYSHDCSYTFFHLLSFYSNET